MATALVKDAPFPKRRGRPVEYAKHAAAIVDNPMLSGQPLPFGAGLAVRIQRRVAAREEGPWLSH